MRQLTAWEKIFTSYISNKGLITTTQRELKKVTRQRMTKPLNKWVNELTRQFSKEEVQMANKHMKKCSTFSGIKEMEVRTILRFHLTQQNG
jgi:hypothetical protein